MSKMVFRLRLPSPNLVIEFDQESGKTVVHACSTAFGAREQDAMLGGEGKVVSIEELVSLSFKGKKSK